MRGHNIDRGSILRESGSRFLLLTSLWGLMLLDLSAQNLVQNPGFEVTTNCPVASGQIALAVPWEAENFSPDLYHACAENPGFKPPVLENFCTFLYPHGGDGFAGMVTYGPVREFIKAPLLKPLVRNQLYYVRFYVGIDDNCIIGIPSVFSDGIGVAFGSSTTIPADAAVENQSGLLKDTSGWTEISGCYKAQGGESYIYVGNFRNNGETQIEFDRMGTVYEDYMYVDDIEVIPFDPLPDTTWLCNDPVILSGQFQDFPVRWSTGEYSPTFTADTAGYIWVAAESDHCLLKDETLIIEGIPVTEEIQLPWCPGSTTILESPVGDAYVWDNGTRTRTRPVTGPGDYRVTLTNGCGSFEQGIHLRQESCACDVFIPNVFSPNGDGINDQLPIHLSCPEAYQATTFQVYNRMGQMVFSTHAPETDLWPGDAPAGTYVYLLTYLLGDDPLPRRFAGDVTIVK
ncbi:MAG: gliding motility-associated C-terminal domain-containing protein [Saprospiraceae bacterium]